MIESQQSDGTRRDNDTDLQTTPVEPMGAVGYFQEFVISLVLSRPLDKRRIPHGGVDTYIIQADRAPFITPRSGPFAILPERETRDDVARCIPWFHLAQRRAEVCQTLERVVKILVTLYNEGVNDQGGRVKKGDSELTM